VNEQPVTENTIADYMYSNDPPANVMWIGRHQFTKWTVWPGTSFCVTMRTMTTRQLSDVLQCFIVRMREMLTLGGTTSGLWCLHLPTYELQLSERLAARESLFVAMSSGALLYS